MTAPSPSRRRRWWLWVLAIVVLVPALALAGGGYWLATMDTASLKPRLEAMATHALRREVRIDGDLALSLLPVPSLAAQGLRVGRLATADGMHVRLAIAPLLTGRVVLDAITLDRPILRLPAWPETVQETSPPRQTPPPANAAAQPASSHLPRRIDIRRLDVEDATLILPDGRSIGGIDAQISQRDGMLTLVAKGRLPGGDNERPVTVEATLSPADMLGGHLLASVAAPGLTARLDGTLAIAARHFDGSVTITAASLTDAVSLVAPQASPPSVPPLRDVVMTSHAEGPWGQPVFTALHFVAGASPLDPTGLALQTATIDAASPSGPYKAAIALTADGQPIALSFTLDTLPSHGPAKLSLDTEAAGARLHTEGTIGWPIESRPLSQRFDLHADDLARLGGAFRQVLPAGAASLSGQVDAPVSVAAGWTATGLDLTAPFGELHGTLGHAGGVRPSWQASLSAPRFDLDPLLAAIRQAAAPLPDGKAGQAPMQSPAPSPDAAPPRRDRLLLDAKLPVAWLRDNDARLGIDGNAITWHGQRLDTLRLGATLDRGKLTIEPAEASGPLGHATLHAEADAAADPPSSHLTLAIPEVALGPLLASFGLPGESAGPARLDADLSGHGETTAALAASLGGTVTLRAGPGQIDDRAVAALFGRALRAASLPTDIAGRSELRCLDAAATLKDGHGELTRLALDTTRLALDGSGAFDLGQETLDLHLKPLLRLGHTGAAIPVHVAGNFVDPRTSLDATGTDGRVSLVLGALTGASDQGSPCGAAAAPAPDAKPKASKPADLLRKLLTR